MAESDTPSDTSSPAESDANLQSALQRLPLFPLPNVVLFPHALLPLHIFEERYRAMVRDMLSGTRYIAVSLIAADAVDGEEKPPVQPIAGVGEVVMAHELPDGRFNLVVRGRGPRAHRRGARLRSPLPAGQPRPWSPTTPSSRASCATPTRR